MSWQRALLGCGLHPEKQLKPAVTTLVLVHLIVLAAVTRISSFISIIFANEGYWKKILCTNILNENSHSIEESEEEDGLAQFIINWCCCHGHHSRGSTGEQQSRKHSCLQLEQNSQASHKVYNTNRGPQPLALCGRKVPAHIYDWFPLQAISHSRNYISPIIIE